MAKILVQKQKNWYNYYWQLFFKYHSIFFRSLILNGNKLRAFKNFLEIKQGIKRKENFDPYLIFLVAMMKVTPDINILSIKLGGAKVGVPMPINERKKIVFAIKWILKLLKDKHGSWSVPLVVDLLISSIYDKGIAIEKKRSTYLVGSQNRHLFRIFSK